MFMANSNDTAVGDSSTTLFNFTFGYLDKSHVFVDVDGVTTAFTWNAAFTLSVSPAPAAAAVVKMFRVTPSDAPVVDFQDGESLSEEDLDRSTLQSLYISQESQDNLGGVMQKGSDLKFDAQNSVIKNVADPVDAQDVATKAWTTAVTQADKDAAVAAADTATTKASEASSSASNAATSESNASTSEGNAADSAAAAAVSSGSIDVVKLAGIEAGATANDTDVDLKARANHTGTQPLSTISDAGDAASKAMASQALAEAGLDNNDVMTALRTKQAIDALGATAPDVQIFTTSGTWTKPSSGTLAIVRMWGAGGGGATYSAEAASGGGGGAYNSFVIPLAFLGATEPVTVGAGGTGTTANQGNSGGNSVFAYKYGYAGGGAYSTTGGGGGGQESIGSNAYNGGDGGGPAGGADGAPAGNSTFGGGGGGLGWRANGGDSVFGGGGGGSPSSDSNTGAVGGDTVYGGGGGGGGSDNGTGGAGGTSTHAGAGGQGGSNGGAGSAGQYPCGGGGGSSAGSISGSGADGKVVITVI